MKYFKIVILLVVFFYFKFLKKVKDKNKLRLLKIKGDIEGGIII